MTARLQAALRIVAGLMLMGVVTLAGVWVANSWLLPRHVGSGTAFGMPELEGKSREEVYALCAERGLVIEERQAEFDASLPNGYLLRQLPRGGVSVKEGRRVSVVFSAGPHLVTLPDLRGRSERQARLRLEDMGLLPGDLLRSAGATPAGTVLVSRPGPGTRVPRGERVDLLLSLGPEDPGYLVPELRHRTLDAALAMLEGSGLQKPRVRYRSAEGAIPDAVLEQAPPPGSRLERGRRLELVVASGSR